MVHRPPLALQEHREPIGVEGVFRDLADRFDEGEPFDFGVGLSGMNKSRGEENYGQNESGHGKNSSRENK